MEKFCNINVKQESVSIKIDKGKFLVYAKIDWKVYPFLAPLSLQRNSQSEVYRTFHMKDTKFKSW